ncbi:MAG: hypothetical protein KDK48_06325, partial [Chlamydiia bacterium]|nr:hypothetical protein [Chlamydiia bacterium]
MQFQSIIEREPFREPALWQELEKIAYESYLSKLDPLAELEERLLDFTFCAYASGEQESLNKIQSVSAALLRHVLPAEKLQE